MKIQRKKYPPLTAAESKAADRYAIDTLGVPSLTLMENASLAAAEYIAAHGDPDSPVLVLCGTGNNGADGLLIARLLLHQFVQVRAAVVGDLTKGTWEFFRQLSDWKAAGGETLFYKSGDQLPEAGILVDAIFGIGLSRPVEGVYRDMLEEAGKKYTELRFAIDIPSGLSGTSGEILGCALPADVTITFGTPKIGLVTGQGQTYAGQVVVADIDLPDEAYQHVLAAR